MHIPHKQYRKVEHSHRKNFLILSLAGMVFLLTIFFSSHDFFSGGMQASILDNATSKITKTVTDKVTDAASNYVSADTVSAVTSAVTSGGDVSSIVSNVATNALGADPASLLSNVDTSAITGAISGIDTSSITNAISGIDASSVISAVSGSVDISALSESAANALSIAQTVSSDALSSLSSLDIGTLSSALSLPSFSSLSSVESFVSGSGIASKVASIFGLAGGTGADSLISRIESMGYEARRDFFGSNFKTVDEVASVIGKLSSTTARDTVLDMLDTGNASQVVNAISVGKAKDILNQMTKDNGARIMNGMDPERAVSLLGQFSPSEALQRLSLMDEKKRAAALDLMSASQLAAIANIMSPIEAANVLTMLKDIEKSTAVYLLLTDEQAAMVEKELDSGTLQNIYTEMKKQLSFKSEKSLFDYVAEAFTIPTAYAADDGTTTVRETEEPSAYQNILKNINDLLAFIFFIIHLIFWPILALIGSLVDNDFVMGDQISEALRSIWINIRDIVNVAFVFVLLAIAFISVLGSEELEQKLPMKTTLPKIILAMVLVNFTFFISRVAIDAVNVLTTAVYAIPTQTEEVDLSDIETVSYQEDSCNLDRMWGCEDWRAKCYATQGGTVWEDFSIDGKSVTLDEAIFYWKNNTMTLRNLTKWGCDDPYNKCIDDQEKGSYNFFIRESISDGSTDYFTYDSSTREVTYTEQNLYALERDHIICHFPMTQSTYFSKSSTGGNLVNKGVAFTIAKNFESLIDPAKFYKNNTATPGNFFTFLFNNIFTVFMFIALFFAFLALAAVLVIRAAVLWALIAISPLIVTGVVVFHKGESLLDTFIQHLIIPLKVALVFVIGFIFMNAAGYLFSPDVSVTLSNVADFIMGKDVDTGIISPNGDSVSILQHIIYLVMTVAILWIGVFKAFESAPYASSIAGFFKSAGNFALQSPKYIPLPIPGIKGGASVASVGMAARGLRSGVLDMQVAKSKDILSSFGIGTTKSAETIARNSKSDAQKFIIDIKNNQEAIRDLQSLSENKFKNTLKTAGFKADHLTSSEIKQLKAGNTSAWQKIKDKDGNNIDYNAMANAIRKANATTSGASSGSSTPVKYTSTEAVGAGTAVAIGNLKTTLKDIDKRAKDASTPEDEHEAQKEMNKVGTIAKTAQDSSETSRGLTNDDAKKIAEALKEIEDKHRPDALQNLDSKDILKIAKSMGVKEVTVNSHTYQIQKILDDPDSFKDKMDNIKDETLDQIEKE